MTHTPHVLSCNSEVQRTLAPHIYFTTCPPSPKSVVNTRNLGEGAYRGTSTEPLSKASAGCLPLQASPGANGTRPLCWPHRQVEVRGSSKAPRLKDCKEQLQLALRSRQHCAGGMYVGQALDKKSGETKVRDLQILGKISKSLRHLTYLIL